MTGGTAVILGSTGRNFGAGMSGGIAYVYDPDNQFAEKCNMEMVELFSIGESGNDKQLKELLENHVHYTHSEKAETILANWENEQKNFVKVYPKEYHEMIQVTEELEKQGLTGEQLIEKAFETVIGTQVVPPKPKAKERD